MEYIFCDTMIFLHFKMFYEIDFCSILNVDFITLMVPEVISAEIDNHKDNHPIKRIRTRAGIVNAKFYEYLVKTPNSEYVIRGNFKVKFLPYKKFDYSSFDLDPTKSDHQIIAAILDFQKTITSTDHITFITHDNGASLTAKKHEISFLRLPDELKLAEEVSTEEQTIKKLEAELIVYKHSSPILELRDKKSKKNIIKYTENNLLNYKIPKNILSIKEIEVACPEYFEHTTSSDSRNEPYCTTLARHLGVEDGNTKENADIKRYMKEREFYFSAYKKYLNDMEIWTKKILIKVELELVNSGSMPLPLELDNFCLSDRCKRP